MAGIYFRIKDGMMPVDIQDLEGTSILICSVKHDPNSNENCQKPNKIQSSIIPHFKDRGLYFLLHDIVVNQFFADVLTLTSKNCFHFSRK